MTKTTTQLKRSIRQLTTARDNWKNRCSLKQDEIRFLRVKVRDLLVSRQRWKHLAQVSTHAIAEDCPILLSLTEPLQDSCLGES